MNAGSQVEDMLERKKKFKDWHSLNVLCKPPLPFYFNTVYGLQPVSG